MSDNVNMSNNQNAVKYHFVTSSDFYKEQESLRNKLKEQLAKQKFQIWFRNSDGFPNSYFTIGLNDFGLPDILLIYNTDVNTSQTILENLANAMLDYVKDKEWDPEEFVIEYCDKTKLEFKFNKVDTDLFMHGVGFASRRYYGQRANQVEVLQVLLADDFGWFPDDEFYLSSAFPQVVLERDIKFPESIKARYNAPEGIVKH